MSRKTTAKPARKSTAWKPSEWYRKAVAADRAREARQFTTAPKARTPEANAKAVAYAEWLAQRDGVSLEALAGPARDHFNETKAARTIQTGRGMSRHTNGPARIPDEWRIKGRVRWEPTQHGYRPRTVEFVFGWAGLSSTEYGEPFHTVELPHWAYEAPEVVAWEEPDEALPLAA